MECKCASQGPKTPNIWRSAPDATYKLRPCVMIRQRLIVPSRDSSAINFFSHQIRRRTRVHSSGSRHAPPIITRTNNGARNQVTFGGKTRATPTPHDGGYPRQGPPAGRHRSIHVQKSGWYRGNSPAGLYVLCVNAAPYNQYTVLMKLACHSSWIVPAATFLGVWRSSH
jgi:hypothetical protein